MTISIRKLNFLGGDDGKLAKMFLKAALLALVCGVSYGEIYDSYSGEPLNDTKLQEYQEAGIVEYCTNDIVLPCDPFERRRLDGTCNNLKNPQRGGFHTPLINLLPTNFIYGDEPAKAKSGNELPNCRRLRFSILTQGDSRNTKYNQMMTTCSTAYFMDVGSIHDSINYLNQTTYCCKPEGACDRTCTPNIIPEDDCIHRWSGIRCMNLTRPKSFESYGCLQKDSGLHRMEFNNPCMDLSSIYCSELPIPQYRMNKSGMLMYDEDDGTTWPPHEGPNQDACMQNDVSACETRCTGPVKPSIYPVQMMTVWIWRLHNYIAKFLAALNPGQSDEEMFHTVRDIVIALIMRILFCELAPIMIGPDLVKQAGIQCDVEGHRETYDENIMPGTYAEHIYVMRSIHNIQQGVAKLYDEDFNYLSEIPVVNMSLRIGKMAIDGNFAKMTAGALIQPAGAYDRNVDYHMSETGLGSLQQATDLITSDLHKGRLTGVQPYCQYAYYLHGLNITKWEDLKQVMPDEHVALLKDNYECVEDVDFLAGVWLENQVEGGVMSISAATVMAKQWYRAIKSDRFWYERADRPYAFTVEQLAEVRKMTAANLLCMVGDKVTKIQRNAFELISEDNPLVSCDEIEPIDFSVWKDESCSSDTE